MSWEVEAVCAVSPLQPNGKPRPPAIHCHSDDADAPTQWQTGGRGPSQNKLCLLPVSEMSAEAMAAEKSALKRNVGHPPLFP